MSIDKETEMKTGMDMAALAEQRDDERQQAEQHARARRVTPARISSSRTQ